MTHSNVMCATPESRWLREPTFDLLEAMAKRPLEITRSEARGFPRAIFGPAGLRDAPLGKGRRVFCLPTTNDALVLDYVEPIAPFEPSPVIAEPPRSPEPLSLKLVDEPRPIARVFSTVAAILVAGFLLWALVWKVKHVEQVSSANTRPARAIRFSRSSSPTPANWTR